MSRDGRARAAAMPLLGPGAHVLRVLARLPLARLRAEAEQRGIAVPPRVTRQRLAVMLVTHRTRAQSEIGYRQSGTAFDSRDDAYPQIRAAVEKHELSRLLDIGCGPGLFAEELRRTAALPANGRYRGLDVSPAAIELAQQRFAEDSRFTFCVGDADTPDQLRDKDLDGIVMSFVLSYLDTHAVHRLMGVLAKQSPNALLLVALTFRSCVDGLDGVEANEEVELDAARRYVAGNHDAAAGIWHVRRLTCYRKSIEARYRIEEEQILPSEVQMLWVCRPLTAKRQRA